MYEIITSWFAEAAKGDFFAGGIALGATGTLAALAHGWLRRAWSAVLRRVFASVTVDNRTAAYSGLYAWLEDSRVLAHVRRQRVTDLRLSGGEVFGPAPGRHWFIYGGRFCLFYRNISDKMSSDERRGGRPLETISITVLFGSVGLIRGWIDAGLKRMGQRKKLGPEHFVLRGDYWQSFGEHRGRSADSVICEGGTVEMVIADVRRFLSAQDWYAQRAVPWRRGYLLYGPPGTGKSSTIRAVATELGLDIASVDVGRAGQSDDDLCEAMATAPKGALLAIEDIDAIFRQREAGEKAVGVSFSGLLNAIDGLSAQEGRALFMTTNHREVLDAALLRPGRADVQIELGPVSAEAAVKLFARFFPDEMAASESFRRALGSGLYLPAELQGWLLAHADDVTRAQTAYGLITPRLVAAE
ncbi:MAG: AAA family ATPase [Deltaproteobacteria bacterium]